MRTRQVVLATRPAGIPEAEHFALVERELSDPGPGQVLVRNELLSVDPAQRGWVSLVPNYLPPVAVGEVMRAFAVGTVVAVGTGSRYRVGERVLGMLGWQEVALVDDAAVERVLPDNGLPTSLALGVLGLTGITAWFGMTELGMPRPGDTVVVSTAAGSVGSIAGQLARLAGARTVGIAGGPAKAALCVEEFGYDAAVDYRSPHFADHLAAALPDGVDVYFDNTAGPITDAVLPLANVWARIVVCGTSSVPAWDPWPLGPRVERWVLTRRLRISGLIVFDYQHRSEEALRHLTALIHSGSITVREEFLDGLESAPDAIAGLYRGENRGKRIIRLPH